MGGVPPENDSETALEKRPSGGQNKGALAV
jgi:hypothetical protein